MDWQILPARMMEVLPAGEPEGRKPFYAGTAVIAFTPRTQPLHLCTGATHDGPLEQA